MAMITCHECGNGVSTSAQACPSCGASVKSGAGRAKKVVRYVWYAACAIVVLIVFRACYRVGEVVNMASP